MQMQNKVHVYLWSFSFIGHAKDKEIYFLCCDCKARVVSALESPRGKCAKLRTMATSNNRDHPTRSLYYCLFAPHIYGYCSSRISRPKPDKANTK